MKKVFLIIIVLFLHYAAFAQVKDSSAVKQAENKQPKKEQEKTSDTPKKNFVDENGDGIDDNTQSRGKGKRRGNQDKFVDKDGDGINDNRCNGLGWGNQGKMKRYGKRGK